MNENRSIERRRRLMRTNPNEWRLDESDVIVPTEERIRKETTREVVPKDATENITEGFRVIFWSDVIDPAKRSMRNLSDGAIFQHKKDARAFAQRVYYEGGRVFRIDVVKNPTAWYDSLASYALGRFTKRSEDHERSQEGHGKEIEE